MESSDLEKKAKEAFIDDHFELAVDLYTQAVALTPANAELFADRAQANIKLRNFTGNGKLVCLFLLLIRYTYYTGSQIFILTIMIHEYGTLCQCQIGII